MQLRCDGRGRWTVCVAMVVAAVLTPAHAGPKPEAAKAAAPAASAPAPAAATAGEAVLPPSRDDGHVIRPGDRLNYRVPEDRDEPVVLLVSSGGEMNVPYFGRVNVGGKTIGDAQRTIRDLLLKDLYNKATVTMSLDTSYVSNKAGQVRVVGAVKAQGPQDMPMGEPYTVSQAILKAGNFTSFADQRKVRIFRKKKGSETVEEIVADVKAVLSDGELKKDVELMPDDHIVVKEKLFSGF